MFRETYEFQWNGILRLFLDSQEHSIRIRYIEVRILPPQPGIPRFAEFPSLVVERPANGGFF
jgi:hypothetical protein